MVKRTRKAAPTDADLPTSGDAELLLDGATIALTNLDKTLYPAADVTKHDVVDYYRRIAPIILPHLEARPVSLKRYPNGVEADFFWEKACPSRRPEWVETVAVPTPSSGRVTNYCVVNNPPTLVWLANLAALELHTSLSQVADLARPTALVFDLDPGPPADIVQCARVGLLIRDQFAQRGLRSHSRSAAEPKSAGSKNVATPPPRRSASARWRQRRRTAPGSSPNRPRSVASASSCC
jgi:bifunctional non-homologous end joining protein LigD